MLKQRGVTRADGSLAVEKLRVAVVCSLPFVPVGGGVIRHISETARALSDRVDHTVFTGPPMQIAGDWYSKSHALATKRPQTAAFLAFNRRLRKVDWSAFDVVHCHMADGYHIPASRRKLVTVHGAKSDERRHRTSDSLSDWIDALPLRLHAPLEGRNARSAAKVIVGSQYVSSAVVRDYHVNGRKIEIIPPAIDHTRFTQTGPSQSARPHVLAVGRLNSRKGFDVLVRAWEFVTNEATLRIVGTGPELPRLKRLAARSAQRNPIEFLGEVSESSLKREYEDSIAVVVPSRQEGFGFASVEAQSAGRAVIVSSAGSLPETVDPGVTGAIFPTGDASALAREIDWALSNRAATTARGERARAFVRGKYDWQAYADRVFRVYKELSS